jgi:hypothetical protein
MVSTARSDANFRTAASAGNPAKVDASCQGSRFKRPSTDTTRNVSPLPSSPIGANRKASNSDPRPRREAGGFIGLDSAFSLTGAGLHALQVSSDADDLSVRCRTEPGSVPHGSTAAAASHNREVARRRCRHAKGNTRFYRIGQCERLARGACESYPIAVTAQ